MWQKGLKTDNIKKNTGTDKAMGLKNEGEEERERREGEGWERVGLEDEEKG